MIEEGHILWGALSGSAWDINYWEIHSYYGALDYYKTKEFIVQ